MARGDCLHPLTWVEVFSSPVQELSDLSPQMNHSPEPEARVPLVTAMPLYPPIGVLSALVVPANQPPHLLSRVRIPLMKIVGSRQPTLEMKSLTFHTGPDALRPCLPTLNFFYRARRWTV